jgi:uncharacterized protein (TIGR03435 family)
MMMVGRRRGIAHGQTMEDLASWLSGQLNLPVTDHTGLGGKYDFVLTFAADPAEADTASLGSQVIMLRSRGPATAPNPEDDSISSVFTAVREQLGLRLEPKRGPVETIVVDHIERTPIAN